MWDILLVIVLGIGAASFGIDRVTGCGGGCGSVGSRLLGLLLIALPVGVAIWLIVLLWRGRVR